MVGLRASVTAKDWRRHDAFKPPTAKLPYPAASDDSRIPKPVSCFTIGSPECGTLSFRRAFAALEGAGRLRCLRIANEHGQIKEEPLKNMDRNTLG